MLHDDPWFWNRLRDGFVRQYVGPIEVQLVIHDHILTQHSHVLHPPLRIVI